MCFYFGLHFVFQFNALGHWSLKYAWASDTVINWRDESNPTASAFSINEFGLIWASRLEPAGLEKHRRWSACLQKFLIYIGYKKRKGLFK